MPYYYHIKDGSEPAFVSTNSISRETLGVKKVLDSIIKFG